MKIRTNKKKFIYLISPIKINGGFYNDLDLVLNTKKVSFFQLRLKNTPKKKYINIGKRIKKICKKYKVFFIINDFPKLAKEIGADVCHLGQGDMNILDARKILGNKIIGITCHNKKELGKVALNFGADYLAFGAFFKSNTKKVKFKAKTKILKQFNKMTNKPLVAIGGINNKNYKNLLLNRANFLAISGYIWNNKKYKPIEAIRKLI